MYLKDKLRAYKARDRRCTPSTPLYAKSIEQLWSGCNAYIMECTYVLWLPFDRLGNHMQSMVSAFFYALLRGRVLLVVLPPDSTDLYCEPFSGTMWLLLMEDDFPVANLVP